mmetsp:Transcript_50545/g.110594  ORF Transcript_50545/g.110594 Transcript_50545/m.110594 type:complete len:225 (+) Transcript_50545:171-845(+)
MAYSSFTPLSKTASCPDISLRPNRACQSCTRCAVDVARINANPTVRRPDLSSGRIACEMPPGASCCNTRNTASRGALRGTCRIITTSLPSCRASGYVGGCARYSGAGLKADTGVSGDCCKPRHGGGGDCNDLGSVDAHTRSFTNPTPHTGDWPPACTTVMRWRFAEPCCALAAAWSMAWYRFGEHKSSSTLRATGSPLDPCAELEDASYPESADANGAQTGGTE